MAFAMGMGGNLHVQVPSLGFVAMLDLLAYVIALPVLFMRWNQMGRFMRRSLYWALAWTSAAMLANMFNFVNMKYWFKCVTLASSSWTIMAVAYLVLRNYPRGYLWYLVGAGISGWIALHYFRNGSLEAYATRGLGPNAGLENLMDKQVFPHIAKGMFWGCALPVVIWWKKFPGFVVICASVFAGFWLLINGGSRSSFGMFCAAAGAGFLVAYGTRAFRRVAKSPMLVVLLTGFGIAVLFGGYKMMAKGGTLGESEADKYENEFGEGSEGAVNGRAGFKYAIEDAWESCLLGRGWHLRNHSVMANALACEGIVGFLFWVYFYLQVLWWVSKRMPYSGKNVTFIALMILAAAWDVFGSPFGTRHKFFVLMTFIALCRDNPHYGVGTIFDEAVLGKRRWLKCDSRYT